MKLVKVTWQLFTQFAGYCESYMLFLLQEMPQLPSKKSLGWY